MAPASTSKGIIMFIAIIQPLRIVLACNGSGIASPGYIRVTTACAGGLEVALSRTRAQIYLTLQRGKKPLTSAALEYNYI